MNIDELTIGQMKEIVNFMGGVSSDDSHWEVGKNYAIRTVTHIDVGTLVKVTDKELVLTDAAWVADTGRWEQFVKDGAANEVEPYTDGMQVIVGRGSLVDAFQWSHPLLRKQK